MPPGRPTKYETGYPAIAAAFMRRGATRRDLAKALSVTLTTIHEWEGAYLEFSNALKTSRELAIGEVENALHKRAVGFIAEDIEEFVKKDKNGENTITLRKVRREVPPDVGAQAFYLKNRAGWRDVQTIDGDLTIKIVNDPIGEDADADPE